MIRPRGKTVAVAVGALVGFVAAVAALHLLEPELAPDRHVISEYVNTEFGPLMTIGFSSWSLSLGLTALVVLESSAGSPRIRHVIAGLLALAATGLVLTACCPTEAVAGVVPEGHELTTVGRLHDVGSGLTTTALLAAVVTAGVGWHAGRPLRSLSAGFAVTAITVQVVLLAVGPEVGGIRQRLLLLVACVWQAALLQMVRTQSDSAE